MPVWISSENSERKFHRSKKCPEITKRPARGKRFPVVSVEIDELAKPKPCLVCYPDAPRPQSWHRYCHECYTARPCEHNGGVPVYLKRRYRARTLFHEPGDVYYQVRHVWPEDVHHYVA